VFWSHLILGLTAGLVILIMSVTGVLLTYEKQIVAWVDRSYLNEGSTLGAPRAPVAEMVAAIQNVSSAAPTTLTFYSGSAVVSGAADGTTYYVDAHTADLLGTGSTRIRAFFRSVTDWHRYVAMSGESRSTGKAITGASNLVFLLIVVSGAVIWWRGAVLWFRKGLRGKALFFNLHNVFGIWTLVPLFLVVLSATVISYPWATSLVYTLTGSEQPPSNSGRNANAAGGRGGGGEGRGNLAGGGAPQVDLSGIDAALTLVEPVHPSWKTIAVRLPAAADKEVTFTVDGGNSGQPQFRTAVVVDRNAGSITRREIFADQNLGRRARSWLRFVHTGEYYGIAGQTIAGIASLAGVGLVLTGAVLSCQRLVAWIRRRGRGVSVAEVPSAVQLTPAVTSVARRAEENP
jgi:uncharacterized iron-regulated membrane protein